jgi:hypothetical protein
MASSDQVWRVKKIANMSDDTKQSREWQRLHRALGQTLAGYGKEDPAGGADYWLVEDNWGGTQQKVCVFNVSFLTPPLLRDVQKLLAERFPTWSAVFALDVRKGSQRIQDQGIEVFGDRIEEQWNDAKLRKVFGEDFKL